MMARPLTSVLWCYNYPLSSAVYPFLLLPYVTNGKLSFWNISLKRKLEVCAELDYKEEATNREKKRGTDHRPEKKEIFGKSVEAAASQMVLVVKNLPANAGDVRDVGSIPGLGRFPGGGHGNPLQNSCLENPMDRGAWWATVP